MRDTEHAANLFALKELGLLPGAVEYEAALAGASAEMPAVDCSPDDLYVLYTGGTTGMPKGVLWRQADILVAALGGRDLLSGQPIAALDRKSVV